MCNIISVNYNLKLLQNNIFRILKSFDGSRTYCIFRSKIEKFYGDFNSDNVSMSSKLNVKIIYVKYFMVTML